MSPPSSSPAVGLDVQEEFTPHYSGPPSAKREVHKLAHHVCVCLAILLRVKTPSLRFSHSQPPAMGTALSEPLGVKVHAHTVMCVCVYVCMRACVYVCTYV